MGEEQTHRTYTGPTCGETMERDLMAFLKHTDQPILDAIKEDNPDWVEDDGRCPP